jgi:hypothetical protein
MIKLKDLLLEKTFKITADVNYVYKVGGFEKFLKEFKKDKNNFPSANRIRHGEDILFTIIDSDKLKTIDAKKANLANPVIISCGVFDKGSFYIPGEKQLSISFHHPVLSIYANRTEDTLPPSQLKRFNNEITEHRIKAAISHELSHWISDSLYNTHIGKLIQRAEELKSDDIMKLDKKDVNMTYFEVDAQIHGIKELKRKFKSKWDDFTLYDIFEKYPSLNSIASHLYQYGQDILNIWQKMLLKRMAREKLLGKNMRNFVKGSEL